MVTTIERPRNIRETIKYNEKKVTEGVAKLLVAEGFPLEKELLSFEDKLHYFRWHTAKNVRTKRNVLHIFLSFNPEDKIDSEKMARIAKDYMQGIGFGQQPYLLYQHNDAGHAHCHIVTICIKKDGERIETYNIGKNESRITRIQIEQAYGLVKGSGAPLTMAPSKELLILKGAKFGEHMSKYTLSKIIQEVIDLYKFRSLQEYNAVLNQFRVFVLGGEEGSHLKINKGLIYGFLNEKNRSAGAPIKASSLYEKPILKKLEPLFEYNKEASKPLKIGIKRFLEKALYTSNSLPEMDSILRRYGIRILLRKTKQGKVHGVTYIDNNAKCVYTARDLGREYSLKALKEAIIRVQEKDSTPVQSTGVEKADFETIISQLSAKKPPEQSLSPAEANRPQLPARDLPVVGWLIDNIQIEAGLDSDFLPSKKQYKAEDLDLDLDLDMSRGLSI